MTLRTLQKTYRMSSKISGLSLSLSFILSFMAVIILLALSSAPCFELFSAAPEIRINMFHELLPLKLNYFFYILKYLYFFFFHSCTYFISVSNSTIFFTLVMPPMIDWLIYYQAIHFATVGTSFHVSRRTSGAACKDRAVHYSNCQLKLTLKAVRIEQILALLVTLDTTLRTADALPCDPPEETLTLVAVRGGGGRP